jgi:type II secretory pathway pseudopilin PulG
MTHPKRQFAFTVPEMLAVVAVIVIILSILMPSLSRARKHAQTAVCLSNVRQLTIAWRTYASEHRGKFTESWQANGGFQAGVGMHWYVNLRRYYDSDKSLLPCPSANLRKTPVGPGGNSGTALDGWKVYTDPPSHKGVEKDDYGGYGINNWLENPDIVGTGLNSGARPNELFIDRVGLAANHSSVPVLGDGVWPDQGWPRESDIVPPNFIDPEAAGSPGWMRRFCLDRHFEAVSLSYMDCSSRTVKIKNLWSQKWNRGFVTLAEVP